MGETGTSGITVNGRPLEEYVDKEDRKEIRTIRDEELSSLKLKLYKIPIKNKNKSIKPRVKTRIYTDEEIRRYTLMSKDKILAREVIFSIWLDYQNVLNKLQKDNKKDNKFPTLITSKDLTYYIEAYYPEVKLTHHKITNTYYLIKNNPSCDEYFDYGAGFPVPKTKFLQSPIKFLLLKFNWANLKPQVKKAKKFVPDKINGTSDKKGKKNKSDIPGKINKLDDVADLVTFKSMMNMLKEFGVIELTFKMK